MGSERLRNLSGVTQRGKGGADRLIKPQGEAFIRTRSLRSRLRTGWRRGRRLRSVLLPGLLSGFTVP